MDISQEKPRIDEKALHKEGFINDLDVALKAFHEGGTASMFLASARQVWNQANNNPNIKKGIDHELRKRRLVIHQMAKIDLEKAVDPVRTRYDPNHWLATCPPELKGKPHIYLVDKVSSLRNLLTSI